MKKTSLTAGLRHSSLALFTGTALLCSQAAFSDATVVYEQTAGTNKNRNTMQIKDGKIRFTPPNQGNSYSLYDSHSGAITHVDSSQRKYLSMDEQAIAEQAKKVKLQMDNMRAQMQAKIKTMPPEQQKQAELMMQQHLPPADSNQPAPQVEQKKTARSQTIANIQCTVYESYVDGVKANEICITSADKLGLSSADTQALMSMQGFMKRMQKVAQNMMGSNVPMADIEGVPLHTRLYGPNGAVTLETRLASISTEPLSADTVTLPADYTPVPMPVMPPMQ